MDANLTAEELEADLKKFECRMDVLSKRLRIAKRTGTGKANIDALEREIQNLEIENGRISILIGTRTCIDQPGKKGSRTKI